MVALLEEYLTNKIETKDNLKERAMRTLHYNIDVEKESPKVEIRSHNKLYDDLTTTNYHNEDDFFNDSILNDYEFIVYFVQEYPNVSQKDFNRIDNIIQQFNINYLDDIKLLYFIIKNAYTFISLIAFSAAKYVLDNAEYLYGKLKDKDIIADSQINDNLFEAFNDNALIEKYGKVVCYILTHVDSIDVTKYYTSIKNDKIRGNCSMIFSHNTVLNILNFCSFTQGFDDENQLLKTLMFSYITSLKEKSTE